MLVQRCLLTFLIATTLWAILPIEAQGTGVEIGGNILNDSRWRPDGDDGYTWNETRLTLKLDKRASRAAFHAESRLRYFSYPETQSLSELHNSDLIQPWHHELYEAYVDVYGLPFENLDLRVGKQRISWGTADKLNVVDNLNPDDFEDILDFTQKLPTTALRLDYYPGDFTLTGVLIPVFTPARSISARWDVPATFPLPPGMNLRTLEDKIELPENRPQDVAMFGFRAKRQLFQYDWSLSYMYGRDEWPLVTVADIVPVDTLGTTDVTLTMEYPRLHIIGADMAGTIGDVGVWAECAVFTPEEKTYMSVNSPAGMEEELVLDDEPYVKYVIGGDYTFKNGIYTNLQYMHGFFTDRGADNLEDYVLFAVEQTFFHDELKVRMTLAAEFADIDDIENRSAYFGGPEVTYYPTDGIEIIMGGMFLEGDTSTQFGQFSKNDFVYGKVRYTF